MTQVVFHVNAPDPAAYTCRLLRKAAAQGARVMVTGAPDDLERMDAALWTFSAHDFVAHCRADAPHAMLRASPVVLARVDQSMPADVKVLVHLGGPPPDGLERFDKVIEVVGREPHERAAARQRWKQYAAQGLALDHHEVAQ